MLLHKSIVFNFGNYHKVQCISDEDSVASINTVAAVVLQMWTMEIVVEVFH